MSEWKTLKDLWDEVGGPFDATRADGQRFHCEAMSPNGDAVGWTFDGCPEYYLDAHTEEGWKLLKPKSNLVPHWPAVIDHDGGWAISNHLFSTLEAARAVYPTEVIRLATELPPIMLPLPSDEATHG